MRAAFLTVDITPTAPAPLAGFAARKGPFTRIDAPLEANVARFTDAGGEPVVLASLDTLFVGEPVRQAVAQAAGLPAERLILVASHTHNAPSLAPEVPKLGGYESAYGAMVVERLAGAIRALTPDTELTAGHATRHAPFNINRRRPAWVLDYPMLRRQRRFRFGREIALAPYRGGIVDQTLRAITLRDGEGTVRAVIWSFACHANRYPLASHVSPDFPGLVREHLRRRFGAGCAVFYLPGLAGSAIADIAMPMPRSLKEFLRLALPFNPFIPWFTPETFRAWGDRLAAVAVDCAANAAPAGKAQVAHHAVRTAPIFLGRPEISLDLLRLDFGRSCGLVAMTGEVIGEWGPQFEPLLPPGWIPTGYLSGPCLYVPNEQAVHDGGYEADRFRGLFSLDGAFVPDLDGTVIRGMAELFGVQRGGAFAANGNVSALRPASG